MATAYEVTGWQTAITRRTASAPVRWLLKNGKLQSGKGLDYGCGRGADADALGFDRFDPYWHNETPDGPYDVITCSYVLNVVEPERRLDVLFAIEALLRPGGTAYISVRRDIPETGSETQWWVELSLPMIYERKGAFAIYELHRPESYLETA